MGTILHRLDHWAKIAPDAPAQRYKSEGAWHAISARELQERVFYLALYLESIGLRSGEVSAIFSYNCPEWVQAELAPQLLGALSAGLYPNSAPKDIDYVLSQTAAKVLFVQNRDYWTRIVGSDQSRKLPSSVEKVIVFDGDTSIVPGAIAFHECLRIGKDLSRGRAQQEYLQRLNPQAGAFLIFTSGTTGNPKGAVLTHDNLAFASDVARDAWKIQSDHGDMFSFLPLCHIAEKLQNIGAGISCRITVNYCSKFENLAQELGEVEPTLLLAVPRVWEKMMEGVEAKLSKAPPARQKLARWALGLGGRKMEAKLRGEPQSFADRLQYPLANKLVLSKIRKALGFGRLELGASGASALLPHVAKWFRQLDLEIYEDYGQTETTGILCMTTPGEDSAGTVGHPALRTEFKLADDGEILTKGRHVFLEYYKNEQATQDTIKGGWLYTGDLGEYTDRKLVKIRGRKKEILKTSGGKMIAPVPIEDALKVHPLISQVCIVGDNRKYLSALVTLSEIAIKDLTQKNGGPLGRTVTDAETIAEVQGAFDATNKELGSFERIKYFTILGREFSIEEGEMTPTMKMKRNVIESRFKDLIDAMYTKPDGGHSE